MKKKALQKISPVIQNRQTQLLRLMKRYSALVHVPNALVLPYSWNFGYVDTADPTNELQYREFFAHTNNAVFAAMIFEAQMLPVKICIAYIEFNNLIRP